MSATVKYERIEKNCRSSRNPKEDAGIFSILSCWWMAGIFKTGSKRHLENCDMFPLCQQDKTQENTERLSQFWASQIATSGRWRLIKALLKAYPFCDYFFVLCTALLGAILQSLQTLFISFLMVEIDRLSDSNTKWAYLHGMGICISSLLRVLLLHQFMYISSLISMRWKSATTGLIYQKVR